MNEEKIPTVWIVDMDNRKPRMVKPATDYQTDGYDQFMADPEKKPLNYTKDGYVFTIVSFDGNSSFCLYTNESGVQRILSNDEKALNEYVKNQNAAIKNATNKKAANQKTRLDAERARQLATYRRGSRVVNGGSRVVNGGNRKTKRAKRSKRAHTAKRK